MLKNVAKWEYPKIFKDLLWHSESKWFPIQILIWVGNHVKCTLFVFSLEMKSRWGYSRLCFRHRIAHPMDVDFVHLMLSGALA